MTLPTRELFRKRCKEHGGFSAVARELGCTRQFLYALATPNGALPGRELANGIDALLGIPSAEWDLLAQSAA